MAMLGASCSACCQSGPCGCPSWCGYKMILFNPDTCPALRYGNSSIGFPDCSSPVPAYVESPYTCPTAPQTISASVKGGAAYQVNGNYIFFGNQASIFNVIAPDDIWAIDYPVLNGTVSGGISADFGSSGGPNNRDAIRRTNGWSASVRPVCVESSGDPVVRLELSHSITASVFDLFYRFNPTRTESLLTASVTRTRRKVINFNETCVSDSSKWCSGEVQKRYKPFPSPLTGWLDVETTSFGNWDTVTTQATGNQVPLSLLPIDQRVNFEIVSRASCNPLP